MTKPIMPDILQKAAKDLTPEEWASIPTIRANYEAQYILYHNPRCLSTLEDLTSNILRTFWRQ